MQPRFVIEVDGADAGIVVAEGRGYRFFAAQKAFGVLDRRMFNAPAAAEAACRKLTSHARPSEEPIQFRPANPCDIMVGG